MGKLGSSLIRQRGKISPKYFTPFTADCAAENPDISDLIWFEIENPHMIDFLIIDCIARSPSKPLQTIVQKSQGFNRIAKKENCVVCI